MPTTPKPSFRRQVLQPLKDVLSEVLNFISNAFRLLTKLLKISPIVTYFFIWSYKTGIRHKLKTTALGIISLSSLFLALEVFMEWMGSERLHDLLVAFDFTGLTSQAGLPPYAHPHNILRGSFIGSVVYLVWHDFSETRKPGYEYKFVKQVNQFMRKRPDNDSEEALVHSALPLFLKIFEKSKAVRCSMFKPNGDCLFIPESYIHPRVTDDSYTLRLNVGEGVAGLVFQERKPLYVPRLYFPFSKRWDWTPSIFFPHAVGFDTHEENGSLEMVNDSLQTKAFKKTATRHPFRSTISVPVKSFASGSCYGVLNLDFDKNDPLDRSEIAMASILGLLLGDEMARIGSTAKP